MLVVSLVDVELHEDDGILENGAQGAQQPTQVQHNVLRVRAVEQNLARVGEVTQTGEQKEKQAQAFHGASSVVLEDLGDSGSQVQEGRQVAHDLWTSVNLAWALAVIGCCV